jgi:hypothetical protein
LFNLYEARGPHERLTELGRFLEFWYGQRRSEYGESAERLGRLALPYPLRWFYAFAGRWPSPESGHGMNYFYTGAGGHHLYDLDRVRPRPDGRLKFFMEYQGGWGGLTLSSGDDPPVWIEGYWDEPADDELDDDERDAMPPKCKQVSEALSKFLVTHFLMTTAYERPNSPYPQASSQAIDTALADWLRKDDGALERIWEAEPDGCPNYDGAFFLFHRHVLVHRSKRGFFKFGALHPEGVEILRRVLD